MISPLLSSSVYPSTESELDPVLSRGRAVGTPNSVMREESQ